jgi:uncharacterized protein (UPF0335 family)
VFDVNSVLIAIVFGYLVKIEQRITRVEEKLKGVSDDIRKDHENNRSGCPGATGWKSDKG